MKHCWEENVSLDLAHLIFSSKSSIIFSQFQLSQIGGRRMSKARVPGGAQAHACILSCAQSVTTESDYIREQTINLVLRQFHFGFYEGRGYVRTMAP